jgi:hypothetical protein
MSYIDRGLMPMALPLIGQEFHMAAFFNLHDLGRYLVGISSMVTVVPAQVQRSLPGTVCANGKSALLSFFEQFHRGYSWYSVGFLVVRRKNRKV